MKSKENIKNIENIENKEYKYRLLFKNEQEILGTIMARDLSEIYDFFLKNKFTHIDGGKKAVYYNVNEILFFEVEEKNNKEDKNEFI
jgi:DNA-binding LytR/AlgR family response regulator